MLMINRNFFANKVSYHVINYIAQSIRVCNIENIIIFLLEYTFLKISLLEKENALEKIVIKKIRCYVHVVDDFKTNFLIKLDIINFKQMIIDYKREMLYINNCREMQILITITFIKDKIKRIVRVFSKIVVLASSNTMIFIRLCDKKFSKKRNLMFISTKNSNRFDINDEILFHIIDVNLCAI